MSKSFYIAKGGDLSNTRRGGDPNAPQNLYLRKNIKNLNEKVEPLPRVKTRQGNRGLAL